MSENNDYITDFIKLQKLIQPIEMNAEVNIPTNKGSFQFKYADLPSIHKYVKPLINENNFVLSYQIDDYVNCILMHVSGESFRSSIKYTPPSDAKQAGALITYYKRYTISALLALDTEEDVDVKPMERRKKAKISDTAFNQACARIQDKEKNILNKVLANFEISQEQHDTLLNLDLEHNE